MTARNLPLLRAAGAAVLLTLPVVAQAQSSGTNHSPKGANVPAASATSTPIGAKSIVVRRPEQAPAVDPIIDQYLRVVGITLRPGKPGYSNVPIDVEIQAIDRSRVVTAWAVTFTETFAGGEQRQTHTLADPLEVLIVNALPENRLPIGHKPVFDTGGIHRSQDYVLTGADHQPPVLVTGQISAVLFQDKTALGDPQQVRTILDLRKNNAAFYEDLVKRFQRIREVPAVREAVGDHRRDSLIRGFEDERASLLANAKPGTRDYTKTVHLGHLSDTLKYFGETHFDLEVAAYQALYEGLLEQTTISGGDK